jgi:hypothetical protein
MCTHPKASPKQTLVQERAQIWRVHLESHKVPYIRTRFPHIPRSTVRSIIKRGKKCDGKSFENLPKSGRPQKISERDEWALKRHAIINTRDTLQALTSPSKSGHQLGLNKVCEVFHKFNIHKRRPRKKPFLKPEHKLYRKQWCLRRKSLKRD